MHPAINPYQAQSVSTASPAQLVLMLYDRALVAIARAERADPTTADGIATVNTELQRAQDIVTELQIALDHRQGGEIAANLHLLYDFCLDRLVDANVTKEAAGLEPVRLTLQALRDTWDESCCGRVPAGV